jgi:multidrug efflux pump subunit AcrA (membrane-fusion protein)
VQTALAESLYKNLKLGQEVKVEIDGQEKPLSAKVARLSPAADPMTHSYTVKLDVSAAGLKSGTFARVLFPTGKQNVLALPQTAVLNRAGITGVFVVDAQGVAQYRMIRTGKSIESQIEVLSGLNPGERVVIDHAQAVNNGDKITE